MVLGLALNSRLKGRLGPVPREALLGGIPWSFLEPLGRSGSHFVGIYRQKMTRSLKNWLSRTCIESNEEEKRRTSSEGGVTLMTWCRVQCLVSSLKS